MILLAGPSMAGGLSMAGPPPGPIPLIRPPRRTFPVPTSGSSQPFREQGELFPLWREEPTPEAGKVCDREA
jgi:hypothetical protein